MRLLRRTRLSWLILLLLTFLPLQSARVQVHSVHTEMSSEFGVSIRFQATVEADTPVRAAAIFYQAQGDTRTSVGLAQVRELGQNRFALDFTHPMEQYYLQPFTTIGFHWELTLADGSVFISPEESAVYSENRFEWQTLEEDGFRVHWVRGNREFGQGLINIARAGAAQIGELLPIPSLGVLDIYVYDDLETMRTALRPGSEEWVAGHANPQLGVILVALPGSPEQQLLAEQRIPHEMMHVLLYQAYPRGYDHLPRWLTEGLASLVERSANPDYRILLDKAAGERQLIRMETICESFPSEASSSLLAYAQSQSFIQYLYGAYGSSGLQNLIAAYASGMDCQNGARQGLGKDLTRLQADWEREALVQNNRMDAIQSLLPWLILLLAVLAAPLVVMIRSHSSKKEKPGERPVAKHG